jgi:peptide/nickel transport system substrate-binding protein
MWKIKGIAKRTASTHGRVTSAAVLLIVATACRGTVAKTATPELTTLTIGFGLVAGTDPETGIQQVARILAQEDLTSVSADGTALAKLAGSWSVSPDGLTLLVHLRPSATFHSGKHVDAEAVRQVLQRQLPSKMGPAFDDVAAIRATTSGDLEFALRHRSTFLLEAFGDIAIREPKANLSGTGPFYVTNEADGEIEMRANDRYYGGRPAIDRIVIKPFTSLRSAWAEMLRGRVDVLYDVGVDALDSLGTSTDVNIFTFQRGYAHLLLLNVKRPPLNDAAFRRELNAAIDRDALVNEVWAGHGAPADGPVWYHNWAYRADLPRFVYHPEPPRHDARSRRFKCLIVDPSHERLALLVQRQLQGIGADIELEFVSLEEGSAKLRSGDFDAVLGDFPQGPNMIRPYLNWHSAGPNNLGHYTNKAVDAALDNIRLAEDDNAYKGGVAALQSAIVDDPPAVFLTWRERARAVSRRFRVPAVPPGTDVLTTVRSWTPVARVGVVSTN